MLKHLTNYRITWISCNSHLLLWNGTSHHQWCFNRNSVQWNWLCHSTTNVRSPRPVEDKTLYRPPPWCILTTANDCQKLVIVLASLFQYSVVIILSFLHYHLIIDDESYVFVLWKWMVYLLLDIIGQSPLVLL